MNLTPPLTPEQKARARKFATGYLDDLEGVLPRFIPGEAGLAEYLIAALDTLDWQSEVHRTEQRRSADRLNEVLRRNGFV